MTRSPHGLPTPQFCKDCPARYGMNDCQCSRDFTRQMFRSLWNRIRPEWIAFLIAVLSGWRK